MWWTLFGDVAVCVLCDRGVYVQCGAVRVVCVVVYNTPPLPICQYNQGVAGRYLSFSTWAQVESSESLVFGRFITALLDSYPYAEADHPTTRVGGWAVREKMGSVKSNAGAKFGIVSGSARARHGMRSRKRGRSDPRTAFSTGSNAAPPLSFSCPAYSRARRARLPRCHFLLNSP